MKTFRLAVLSAAILAAVSPARAASADDDAITSQVEAGLLDGEGIWSSDIIRVETIESVVYLRGKVSAERDRQRAGEVAQSVAGVQQVVNDLRVR
jgi:hyperosmotically inducible periplasmic protein